MKNKNLSILVVDDEAGILEMFKNIFKKKGWNVFTAPTGNLALELVEKENLDLILLDIRLPDISGMDVLKEIKQKHAQLPVIMVTGFGYDNELVNEALRLGASGYVSKGMSVSEVVETVDNVLTE